MYLCNSTKTKHIACEINSRFTLVRFLLGFTSEIFLTSHFPVVTPWSGRLPEQVTIYSADPEISHLLPNSTFHCHLHENPIANSVLSQINPVPNLTPYFLSTFPVRSLLFYAYLSKRVLPLRFSVYSFVCTSYLSHACYKNPSWHDHPHTSRRV